MRRAMPLWLANGHARTVRSTISQVDLNAINAMTDAAAKAAAIDALDWDGSRLFQAARFVTEMQYQHLVFEEFARRVQPLVDPFIFTNSADLDPAIIAEFAHTVYRFGHSMLTDTVDRLDNNLHLVDGDEQVGLIEAFLNPQLFTASGQTASGFDDEAATGALIRGMSRSVGNEMDEFVVEALRNNLLGLPLDLPALNLARGRETGIPSLNEFRAQIYEMTGAVDVKPYTSWIDFAQHIKHPLSIVNFIAAYGTHTLITNETTLEGKRAAAMAIVLGQDQRVPDGSPLGRLVAAPVDRLAFLNATGDYVPDGTGTHDDSRGGLNNVDLWIGGLAEELNEFGGELGSTFNFIFEYQMEHLQNGDRFYYLSRTQGMNLLNMLEPNTFTDLVMRNTDLGDLHATHLPALLMSVPDMTFELDNLAGQANYSGISARDGTNPSDRSQLDPTHDDPFLQAIDPKVVRVQGVERVAVIGNSSFELDSLASGAPNVQSDPRGNYTFTPPSGWSMSGIGGVFAPAASVINQAGLAGAQVAWLGQDALLAKDTGQVLEKGIIYRLSIDVGDRLDLDWPGGVARLVAENGTVLASKVLEAPVNGNWATVIFQTDPIAAALDGQKLRIEIQQTGGTGNQILVNNVRLDVVDADGQKIYDGGILKFSGGEHVVLGGTEGNDSLYGDKGIDTLWGDGGNDYLNAGMESDNVFGGDGDDIIEDPFGDNFLRGEAGDDVIVSDTGITLMFGGEGQDFIAGVTDFKEVFAGPGNDFILGGTDSDVLMGNEGDDWIEGGRRI